MILRFVESQCPEAVFLATYLAALVNPHVHMDLQQMPEAERQAEIETVKDMLEELSH